MECFSVSSFALLVCLLCSLSLVHVEAQNRIDEVQALTAFKKAIDIPSNRGRTNYWYTWDETDRNACKWAGVTCTTNFTVVVLDLSGWYLDSLKSVGILSRLRDLRELYMSQSELSTFPEDISNLTHLTRLDFSHNYFSSSIPQSISACRNLQYLDLQSSSLDGVIPDLSSLVNLQFLSLADNYLEGPFPKELGEIRSLIIIDLSINRLNGSIPSLKNSTNLAKLLLDYNAFVGFEEHFYINARNLQFLQVKGNQLEGNFPLNITKLANLSTIDLSSNQLSGNIPSGFTNLMVSPSLNFFLNLSHNQLSGSIPLEFLQLPSGSSGYITLNVAFNHLNGTIPAPAVDNTTEVDIDLNLSHNQLHGPVPSQLSGVFWLLLNDNLLSGDIIDVLAESQTLPQNMFVMNLGSNLFTGDLTRMTFHWANWSSLAWMDLSNNSLSWRPTQSIPDPVGAALENFPFLVLYFSVSHNNFSGTSLPVGPLSPLNKTVIYLLDLDLSNNQLEGVISDAVFNTTLLPYLSLLNLSNNQITGEVPESIVSFPNDTDIDLSYNKLSGRLPVIPWSSTLTDPKYLEGNTAGLCGYPLPECPVPARQSGVEWWIVFLIVGGSVLIAVSSCLVATWRWRVYHKRHRQDEDLIRTLMERESVTLMPLRYLSKATDGFAATARIGEGGFGTVYKGKLNDGTIVAIKRNKREGSEMRKDQFLNEVRILSQVNHRHLVKLLGCCMETNVALLVFEFIPNGTLQEHLQGKIKGSPLSWKQRLTIAVQTADALNYLHSAATFPIYHRDVKSANILLNDDLSAKVADFGISKLVPVDATHVSTALQGTMGYMDPEYWTSFQLTDKSDVYSFGVVLLELISARPAVDFRRGGEESGLVFFASPLIKSGDVQKLIDPALQETYGDPDGYGRESILSVGRLALKCLETRSRARPTMNEVLNELQKLHLELPGSTSTKEKRGYSDEESENESARRGHLVLLSRNVSGDSSWMSDLHPTFPLETGSVELTGSRPSSTF